MSNDQEPTPAQSLRHLLRDLHKHLDADALRFMSTRQRAIALLPLLTGLTRTGETPSEQPSQQPSPAPTQPAGGASPRRRAGAASRNVSGPARGLPASAGERAERTERTDASGLDLGSADDEPAERPTVAESFVKWLATW